jgi:hypothetical protein
MFVIHMPKTFHIGDTANCRINKKPARITWRDADTLVIEPNDARAIITSHEDGDLICFTCGDPGEVGGDYAIDNDAGGGFTVSFKR